MDWIDDADSRVNVVPTAIADLYGIVRLGAGLARGTIKVPVLGDPCLPGQRPGGPGGRHGQLTGQLARFIGVGVASTVVYVLLYLLLRDAMAAQAAKRRCARPSRGAEVAVLVAANLVATVVRFALYRSWVFRGASTAAPPAARSQPAVLARSSATRPDRSPQ